MARTAHPPIAFGFARCEPPRGRVRLDLLASGARKEIRLRAP
jgi:hypothetical protein